MGRKRSRARIVVTLLGMAALIGVVNVFGRAFVERTLGWAGSALPLFLICAVLSLLALWNFLVYVSEAKRGDNGDDGS